MASKGGSIKYWLRFFIYKNMLKHVSSPFSSQLCTTLCYNDKTLKGLRGMDTLVKYCVHEEPIPQEELEKTSTVLMQ